MDTTMKPQRNGNGNGHARVSAPLISQDAAPNAAPEGYAVFMEVIRTVRVQPVELTLTPAPFHYPPGVHVAPFVHEGRLVLVVIDAAGRLAALLPVDRLSGAHDTWVYALRSGDDIKTVQYDDIEVVDDPRLFERIGHPLWRAGVFEAPWRPRDPRVQAEILVTDHAGELWDHVEIDARQDYAEIVAETCRGARSVLDGESCKGSPARVRYAGRVEKEDA